jgi:P-type E1-E2 ATPase
MMILAVGPNSANGKIMETINANKTDPEGTPLQKKLISIASAIGKMGLIAGILTSIAIAINIGVQAATKSITISKENSDQIVNIFIIGVVVVVVAIPEGLPLAVTMSLAFSVRRMLFDQNLVRRMESCETMGGANYICTDKTGTLTKNQMNITRIFDCLSDVYL